MAEKPPDATKRLPRYVEVTERSGVFKSGWEDSILGTDLQQLWRDHLLVLAIDQDPGGLWQEVAMSWCTHRATPALRTQPTGTELLEDDGLSKS